MLDSVQPKPSIYGFRRMLPKKTKKPKTERVKLRGCFIKDLARYTRKRDNKIEIKLKPDVKFDIL